MPKRPKTILATEVPTIKFKKGLFVIEFRGKASAYPPDLFIATHAAAGLAIKEWQEANAETVVVLLKKRGH